MKWLIWRASVVWLLLIVMCTVGIAVGRIQDAPNIFQELGFDTCDGEACFRGIKLGTDWHTAQALLPMAMAEGDSLELPVNMDNILGIQLSQSSDQTVRFIGIDLADPRKMKVPATSAGAIVAQYGAPCRIDLYSGNGVPRIMLLIYPTLTVFVDAASGVLPAATNFRLRPESPVVGFWITGMQGDGRCANTTSQYVGPWQGFTSTDVYRARYSRALNGRQR